MVFISGVWAQRGASRHCEIGTNLLQEGGKKAPGLYLNTAPEQYPRQPRSRRYYAYCHISVKFISHERETEKKSLINVL